MLEDVPKRTGLGIRRRKEFWGCSRKKKSPCSKPPTVRKCKGWAKTAEAV